MKLLAENEKEVATDPYKNEKWKTTNNGRKGIVK